MKMMTIYVVKGSGYNVRPELDYDDYMSWTLCAFGEEAQAKEMCRLCLSYAKKGENPYDLNVSKGMKGVSYSYYAIDLLDGLPEVPSS